MAPRMTPTIEYATIVILDIGRNTATPAEKSEKSFFENGRQCAMRIIERNIMIQSKNYVGIILVGANKTQNALNDQCKKAFKYIEMTSELQAPTWQMIRDLPETASSKTGDWFEALVVAAHHFKDGISGVTIKSKKIVLITNFEAPANIGDNYLEVVNGFQEENFEVYVIGPDLKMQDSKDVQAVVQFVNETSGDTATFAEALNGWNFHKKKAARLSPQNFDLSFGTKIKIPVSMYIRVRDEPVVHKWLPAIKNPVTLTASTTEGVKRDTKIINTENQAIVQKIDTIEAYSYGQQIIPFSENDKTMLYQSGERSLSIYGFTKASNINWQNLQGDGTFYVFGRKDNNKAQYAITCLVECLHELKLVALVRKVHCKNTEPKMFALSPVIDTNNFICLSMIGICYKEEIKHMAFPPSDLKKFACSDEQVNAFKDLISAMDLTKAYEHTYSDKEAFPIAETVSPSIQYILDCIAFRAMNPGKPLPEPRDDVMLLFKTPPLIEKRAREPIDKLKKVFTLKKVEPNKSRKKANIVPHTIQANPQTSEQMNVDYDMPRVQLPVIKDDEVCSIGTMNPIKDFEILKEKGKSLEELSPEITEVIENLVYTNFGGDYSKVLETMKRFREECVKTEPSYYNNWLQKFKRDLIERKKDTFLKLAENEVNYILKAENWSSKFSEENNHEDSQLYENDTLPNSTELTIRSEVNDLFDEM